METHAPTSPAVLPDSGIPFLAEGLDPALAQVALQAALQSWRPKASRVEIRGARLVRHKPGRRALIEYEAVFTGEDGVEHVELLGKIRAKGIDRKTPAVMRRLRDAGFAPHSLTGGGAFVPEVAGEVPEWHMWLQSKVAGAPLSAWPSGHHGMQLARAVAHALLKLHHTEAKSSRRHTAENELQILQERLVRLAAARQDWESRLHRLLAACRDLTRTLHERPLSGIHRDFHPGQILADGERLWLLDFDLYCQGDPALDVGNFLGHLTEQSIRESDRSEVLSEVQQAVASHYCEHADAHCRSAIESWHTLTLARHVSISTEFPERRPFTGALLACCEKRLGLS